MERVILQNKYILWKKGYYNTPTYSNTIMLKLYIITSNEVVRNDTFVKPGAHQVKLPTV